MHELKTAGSERVSREYVASLLEYSAQDGSLTWKVSPASNVRVGAIAGTIGGSGYRQICISRKIYQAHRLVWLLVHGEWPSGVIDHINGIKTDNRITNLRACSHAENQRNAGLRRSNTSGVKGVHWNRARNAWQARLKDHGKTIDFGYFKDLGDAERAMVAAREKVHGEFANHGQFAKEPK